MAKAGTLEHSTWKGRTDGTPWMQRALISLFKFLPSVVMYFLMGLVIPFYMLSDHRGYLASYRFFRRLGRGPVGSFIGVYCNEFNLGMVVLDRFAMFSGKSFDFEVEGMEEFTSLAEREDGFMMLSAHFGNYEIAGYTLRTDLKKIYALVFPGETGTMTDGRARMFSDKVEMIPLTEDLSHVFALSSALSDGQIVSMSADRLFGSRKFLTASFLGQEAPFPMGPFRFASSRKAPVLGVLVAKTGIRSYKAYVRRLDSGEGTSPQTLCTNYSHMLEEAVGKHPEQWYNFFDFWAKPQL